MGTLQHDIHEFVERDGYNEHCIVTVNDVIEAASRIKFGKHDGHFGLSTDHVKHACDEWFRRLFAADSSDRARLYYRRFICEYCAAHSQGQELKLFGLC